MRVSIEESDNTAELLRTLQKLGRSTISVGILGDSESELAKIARVHEFGMTIKPKKSKYLTIPAHPSAKGKKARDFSNLYFIPTANGNGLLVRDRGRDAFDVIFVLVKSVTIPERSFLRSGYDENIDKITNKVQQMMPSVLENNIDVDIFLNAIGQEFVNFIQKKMKSSDMESNSAVTIAAKGSDKPLRDTGRLIGAIKHEVK